MSIAKTKELDIKDKEVQDLMSATRSAQSILKDKEDIEKEHHVDLPIDGEKKLDGNKNVNQTESTIDTGHFKPHVDTEEVVQCIKQTFKKFYPALSALIEGLLQPVTNEMLVVNLIPSAVEKNPSADAILSFFLSGLDFMDELKEIEDYCGVFFSVFIQIGGQFVDAAIKIKKTIQGMVKDKVGILFNVDRDDKSISGLEMKHNIDKPVNDEFTLDTDDEDDEPQHSENSTETTDEVDIGLMGKHESGTQQDKKRIYPLRMCKYSDIESIRKGHYDRTCSNCYKEDYPQILVLNPSHEVSTHFKHNLEVKRKLSAQTQKLSKTYQKCSASTWSALIDRDDYKLKDDQISIHKIKIELATLGISYDGHYVTELHDKCKYAISPGWWKIEPIHHLAKHFISDSHPQVIIEWNNYIDMFKTYISEHNQKNYAHILFNTNSDNIFILETDECYDKFNLEEISMLRDTMSYIYDLPELSLHLICVKIE